MARGEQERAGITQGQEVVWEQGTRGNRLPRVRPQGSRGSEAPGNTSGSINQGWDEDFALSSPDSCGKTSQKSQTILDLRSQQRISPRILRGFRSRGRLSPAAPSEPPGDTGKGFLGSRDGAKQTGKTIPAQSSQKKKKKKKGMRDSPAFSQRWNEPGAQNLPESWDRGGHHGTARPSSGVLPVGSGAAKSRWDRE